jgi:ribosomal protein S18 acetylase RimI-like enzyme
VTPWCRLCADRAERLPDPPTTLTGVSVAYTTSLEGVAPEHLQGFFEGWPTPPTPERHLEILRGSNRVVLAREAGDPRVIGFVNALSDGVLYAFVPLLEVLPAYRGRGVGSELVRCLLEELADLYAVDLLCDAELVPFYARFGMRPATAMAIRNYGAATGQ